MTNIDDTLMAYPHICFQRRWEMGGELNYMLGECDAMAYALSGSPLLPEYRETLHALSMQKGAQATTAIEGNTLSDEEIERVWKKESLQPSQAYQQREVESALAAFNTLLTEIVRGSTELVTPQLLLRFHEMIGRDLGEHFGAIPGQFASARRQVGPYRAPAHEHVPALVARLCDWLRTEFHYPNQRFSEAVVQAIVTHVYIEWIHPFDDGNGRTGRLVEFYILMRAGLPSLASHLLANHYNNTRPEYYRQLQKGKQERDLTSFLLYAITGLRDGLRKAVSEVQLNSHEQMWRVLVFERFAAKPIKNRVVFRRQRAIALALPLHLPVRYADVPSLNEELAAAYAGASHRTLSRDIAELDRLNLIVREPGLIRANRALLDGTLAVSRNTVANRPRNMG
jgi:Fic family protein